MPPLIELTKFLFLYINVRAEGQLHHFSKIEVTVGKACYFQPIVYQYQYALARTRSDDLALQQPQNQKSTS